MSPPFIFRIDEIGEHQSVRPASDSRGHWIPSTVAGNNVRVGGGASGIWWYCNRSQIQRLHTTQPPQGAQYYNAVSMFFCAGYGFWVLQGDASNPPAGESWQPLRFDYDDHDFSSYVTNAGERTTLHWTRPDQQWPRMLFPDIYHNSGNVTQHTAYGGLNGDLPILLALIAFSMGREHLVQMLPLMFQSHQWAMHALAHGRIDRRGVVVYVYTCPEAWAPPSTTSELREELRQYENGEFGNYYN